MIICLDYSKDMMGQAKQWAENRQIQSVCFMQGDVGKLSFDDGGFNPVLPLNIVGFYSGLILLGIGGLIQPTISALLHNVSTLGISLKSMENLL